MSRRLCGATHIYATAKSARHTRGTRRPNARVASRCETSREDPAALDRRRDALHRDDERRLAKAAVVRLGGGEHELHRPAHVDLEALLDLRELPVEAGAALHPFEVGDDAPARVREHIGHDRRTAAREDLIGVAAERSVRALND